MATLQDVVDLARRPLNDDDKVRWPDAELLAYGVQGLLNSYRKRYELYIGATKPALTMTLLSAFPLPDEFLQPLAEYVTAKAHGNDDEAVSSGKFQVGLQMFTAEVPQ